MDKDVPGVRSRNPTVLTVGGGQFSEPTQLDKDMNPYIEMMEKGIDPDHLDQDLCLHCIYNEMCGFTRPPQKEEI
ncbi:hypothetical protein [Bilifractor sp. HCP3S3_D3]|uniref:hypothetical protein n=1 Tax=Bilifractor sp. HCP3S3_D3 TaxID=3438907 RepID=UPI003F898D2C